MASHNEVMENVNRITQLAGRYVTFILSGEEYCIDIRKVQQIIQMDAITLVPRAPAYVKGVINLRGKVVPVVDFRIRFDMDIAEVSEKNCIVVMQIKNSQTPLTVGVIFDEVKEVTQIQADQLDEVPSFGEGIDVSFLLGVARIENTVRMILDIDSLFSREELDLIKDGSR